MSRGSGRSTTITLDLSSDQAWALAQMCKRFTYHHAVELSDQYIRYPDGSKEHDVMLEAVNVVTRALRDAGVSPR